MPLFQLFVLLFVAGCLVVALVITAFFIGRSVGTHAAFQRTLDLERDAPIARDTGELLAGQPDGERRPTEG